LFTKKGIMRKPYPALVLIGLCVLLVMQPTLFAQSELAATLEVLSGGVEVQRVNTEQWIPVQVEAIVGVGDRIRTDGSGRANIVYFADGTETEILPDTEYSIDTFEGTEEAFNLSVSVLGGQTIQRLNRLLDASSSYDVNTPGMQLVARGTEFRVRVEDSGRGAMLVSEGNVDANAEGDSANVPTSFGIRSAEGEELSDVVQASTFEALDSALDGCAMEVTTEDDVRLNVRIGPAVGFSRVGTLAADEITLAMGIMESGDWYRIDFRGGFGWILSSTAVVEESCSGLRTFPVDYGPEDVSLYDSLGDDIDMDDIDTDAPPPPPPADDDSGEAEEAEGASRSGGTESSTASAGAGSGAAGNDTTPASQTGGQVGGQTGGQAGGQVGGSLLPGSVGAEVGVGGIEINANVELPPVLSGNGALNLDLNLND
jgi:hypothetical protein